MSSTSKLQPMKLLDLPEDLLICIADNVEYSWELNAFARVNRHLHTVLNTFLYQCNIKYSHSSALEWGAKRGRVSTVQKMLDEGASPTAHHKSPWEPLATAAHGGHEAVVRLFLERGISPNSINGWCLDKIPNTPLSLSIMQGHESVARALLAWGADSKFLLDDNTLLSAMVSEAYYSVSLLKLLVDLECDTESPSIFDETPLMHAVMGGHVDAVRYLLQIGVNPNARGSGAKPPPLYYAVTSRHLDVARCLIEYGADVNPVMTNEMHFHPLQVAMRHRQMAAVELLLEHVDLTKFYNNEQYMLLCAAAAACGSEALVQQLVDNGCHSGENEFQNEASFRRQCSSKALPWAAEMGHEKAMMQLLCNGANPDIPDAPDSLHCSKPLVGAVEKGHLHIAKLLLGEGANPNTKEGTWGSTPLLKAIGGKYLGAVAVLLKEGADPNIEGGPWPGEKPLIMAIKEGHVRIVKMLLDRGADPNTRDHWSYPALSWAIHNEVIFRLLLKKGADPRVSTSDETVLMKAIRLGKATQFQMLLYFGAELKVYDEGDILRSAGSSGGAAMIERLFHYGLEEPHPESQEAMAMVTAAIKGQSPSGLKFLLDRGYTVPRGDHFSYICQAWRDAYDSYAVSMTIIDILQIYGVDINAKGRHERTCLWEVIDDRNTFVLEQLLKKGANPLSQDKYGGTPLSHAVTQGLHEESMILIESLSMPGGRFSREELKCAISSAKSEAAAWEEWKIVQVLQRFYYYWNLGSVTERL